MANADIGQQVDRLKRRIAESSKERASAEHQLAVARDHKEQAEKALRDEFGVSPGEVTALAEKLEADLLAEVARVEKLLEKAEDRRE